MDQHEQGSRDHGILGYATSFSQKGIWWVVIGPLAWGTAFLFTGTGAFGFAVSAGIALGVVSGIAIVWLLQFPVQKDIDKVESAKTMGTM